MKLGLIARCESAQGLAIQSKSFYDNMPVDRVLLVDMPRRHSDLCPEWYPGATVVQYDANRHELPQGEVRHWMNGLDVVFTAETPYDWRLPNWARQMRVKTVVQGNPEFIRHNRPDGEGLAHPDEWWWPSSWRLKHLPPGPVMPCPMPDDTGIVATPASDGPLRVLHVAGKRAFGDRNGTDVFASSLRATTRPIHVTMYSIDYDLPEVQRQENISVDMHPGAVANRWEMYHDHHILVLPRRYGGNCLPALEAAACGLAVAMPDVSPNNEDQLASVLLPVRGPRTLNLACGPVETAEVHHMDLGRHLDHLAGNRRDLARAQSASYVTVPRWSTWRPRYLKRLEMLCGQP